MKKVCFLLLILLLTGCQKQPVKPNEMEVCQYVFNADTGSRYKKKSAFLNVELTEKVLSLYDSLLGYDGEKKDVSDSDGNEHLGEYQCHWEKNTEERIYLSSDETNPYLYYSDGGFGTKEGKLWYVSTIHNKDMEKTVLSLQDSFSLILKDIPEVEA